MSELLDDLRWRGLIHDVTDPEGLAEALEAGPVTLYVGYDPTAESLHLGHLQIVLLQRRFQLAGHRVIALSGGGTGLIGDPSGKTDERSMLDVETVRANTAKIAAQLERLLPGGDGVEPAVMEDNLNWLGELSAVELLRDVGKHFPVSQMVARESVAARIGEGGSGMSFTEFSYMVLQAYDFAELYDRHGCRLQLGGSDQWGNITAGLDYMRRTGRPGGFGLTAPLIVRSDGRKFGKTEEGTVWLDPARTSPFALYQYFVNLPDADAKALLRRMSLRPAAEIQELEAAVDAEPQARRAQRELASELTEYVHGAEGVREAEHVTAWLFGDGELPADPRAALRGGPLVELDAADLESWEQLAVRAGLASSLSEARRTIAGGGLYANDERIDAGSPPPRLGGDDALLLRKGKRHRVVAMLA